MQQTHIMDLCPVPAVQPVKVRKTKRERLAAPPEFAGHSRERVLAYIKSCGTFGATDEEIQTQLDMTGNTQRPRRVELWHAGKIVDSGRTRRTASKVSATVWVDADVKGAQ